MDRFIKLIVLWLLVIALPVQGIAAATMSLCIQSSALNPIIQTSSAHIAEGAEHHHHNGAHSAESLDAPDGSSPHHNVVDHGQCKAGCCMASLITASTFAYPITKITAGLRIVPIESQLFSRFIPDGLERPPRHFQI